MTICPRRGNIGAFTLLELILSMAMVAMISLSLYAAMRIGFRARGSAEAQTAAARPAAIVLDLLQSDFESVPLPTGKLASSFNGATSGEGANAVASVSFYTFGQDLDAPEASPFANGLRQVELALRTDGAQPLLVRRVRRNLLAPSELAAEEEVLARNVRAFSLLYYDGAAWQTNWDSTVRGGALPQAVQMTIELDQPARQGAANYRMSRLVTLACTAAPAATASGAEVTTP